MRKIGTAVIAAILMLLFVVYAFRNEIFQYSAENIIIDNLPPYVSVDRIIFDLKKRSMKVTGLRIDNPSGYENDHFAEIGNITCEYEMRGKTILEGIEVTSIKAKNAVINIERLPNGRVNINEMDRVMNGEKREAIPSQKPASKGKPGRKNGEYPIYKLITLTDTVYVNNGKVVFLDKWVRPSSSYELTFENINGNIVMDLSEDYKTVIAVQSQGSGNVNGAQDQIVNWKIFLDPREKNLTMSNRYELDNVDITLFKPYYDQFSPIYIQRGWCSGTLVFDFDDGNIGSTNTLRIRDLKFQEQTESKGTQLWNVTISDLIKYLRSSSGEVVVDFKIKGDMKNPQFYPGPVLSSAIQSMAVNKIAELLSQPGDTGSAQGQAGLSESDALMNSLQQLLKK